MNKIMKTMSAVGMVAVLAGCNAHSGGFNNAQMGTVIGGVAGGVVGNHFGKGSGKTAATAVGAVIGAMTGSSVGSHMDRPHNTRTVIVREPRRYRRHGSGVCAGYANEGVRAACNRGVAEREAQRQRDAELDDYHRGRGVNPDPYRIR